MAISSYLLGIILLANILWNLRCEDTGFVFLTLPQLGQLKGSTTTSAWTGRKIYQFLSVKYADCTRFSRPVLVKPWIDIKDTTNLHHGCPSKEMLKFDSFPENSEDCLYMSIYSTDLKSSKPVIIFIYGHFFEFGSNKFQPNYLLENDVVLVVPQFRLGPFGFLPRKNTPSGNFGVQDVFIVLKWVKKYISNFGGNPRSVTLAGHNGGAAIAHALSLGYLGETLFHKLILVSGSHFAPWAMESDVNNCKDPIYNFKSSMRDNCTENIYQCLQNLNVSDLLIDDDTNDINIKVKTGRFKMVHDSSIVFNPIHTKMFNLQAGNIPMPTLAGVTKHPGTLLLYRNWKITQDQLRVPTYTSPANMAVKINLFLLDIEDNGGMLSRLVEREFFSYVNISNGNLSEILDGLIDLYSTVLFKSPVFEAAKLASNFAPNNTFLYTFDYKGEHELIMNEDWYEIPDDLPFKKGITNFDDLQYLFPIDGKIFTDDDKRISKILVDMWTSFARNGIPVLNADIQPPSLTGKCGPYLHVNRNLSIGNSFLDEFLVTQQDGRSGISIDLIADDF